MYGIHPYIQDGCQYWYRSHTYGLKVLGKGHRNEKGALI